MRNTLNKQFSADIGDVFKEKNLEFLRFLLTVLDIVGAKNVEYAVIGGLAILLRGINRREIHDVDLVVLANHEELRTLKEHLLNKGFTRVDNAEYPGFIRFVDPSTEIRGDILGGVIGIEEQILQQASYVSTAYGQIKVANIPSLIASKVCVYAERSKIEDKKDLSDLFKVASDNDIRDSILLIDQLDATKKHLKYDLRGILAFLISELRSTPDNL